jgi:putative phosphoesterase
MRIGVLADTHNLLRPRVLERLAGCDRLLHAGDVGDVALLAVLAQIAPVTAVRGNTDEGAAAQLPEVAAGDLGDLPYRMVHRREDVDPAWLRGPQAARLVVYGHSHRPELAWQGDCLLLNPGACGPRRFALPLTVAVLTVDGRRLVPEILAVE